MEWQSRPKWYFFILIRLPPKSAPQDKDLRNSADPPASARETCPTEMQGQLFLATTFCLER